MRFKTKSSYLAGSFPAVALADVLRVIVPTGEETLTSAAGEYLSAGMGLVTADGDGMLLTSAAVGLITAGGGGVLLTSAAMGLRTGSSLVGLMTAGGKYG